MAEPLEVKVDVSRIRAAFPRIDDYFGEWAILPRRMQAAVSHVKGMDLVAHVKAAKPLAMREDESQASYDEDGY